ncbi:RHS repeat domain-containing protein [Paenibacillus sonchi]|uniref:RHS repeat domain-containing protein n=1 Tax=Paenibacillus sonchi TaxID=373687 RepID=UPI001E540986|nr:RHS repeat-associated core domain-containing protein [Paenibacillus sonchi]MCE3202638.1 RHS repeat-associated core domain-containing protein [Paenibacillus sonchi]
MRKNTLIKKIFLIVLNLAIIFPNLTVKAEGNINTSASKGTQSTTMRVSPTPQPSPSPQSLLKPTATSSPEFEDFSSINSKMSLQAESVPPIFSSVAKDVYNTKLMDIIRSLKALTLKKQEETKSSLTFSAKTANKSSFDLSKEEIEKLVHSGASVEDIYWINLLHQYFPLPKASDLWNLKKNGKEDSWKQVWIDLEDDSSEDKISVGDSVYSELSLIELLENKQTVTRSVYQEVSSKVNSSSVQRNSFDASVNSVFSGLFTQQQINQTGKQQYSDRSGNSELIDPASGSLTWKETEISLPGRDGLDLNIGVMYNSNQSFAYMRNYESSGWIKKYNYLNSRYDLGIGWSLQFPSVQMADGYKYYHDGQGAVYQIDFDSYSGQQSYSHLVGFQGKKIRFMKDDLGSFTNGQASSAYYLEYLDKKREYFDSDGLLLGIVDRFGNKIVFQHVDRALYDGTNHKVISVITDSVGRTVNFNYENNLNTTGTFAGERIVVTVNSNSIESQRVVFTKARASLTFNGNPDGYAPVLWRTTDQVGQDTFLDYDSSNSAKFNYETKVIDGNAGYNSYHRLTKVTYPTSYTKYNYEMVNRNLGSNGIGQEYRVTLRQDILSNKYNEVNYSYSGDYMGDTDPYNPKALDASYIFSSTNTVQSTTGTNGLTTTTTFNGNQQLISTSTQAANRERRVVANTAFDSVLTHYPTQIRTSEYGVGDSDDTANQTYTEIAYTEWGEVKSQTQPLLPSQFNNINIKLHYTTTFTYEPTYHFLESQTWYQNEGEASPSIERYQYTPSGRVSNFINAINEETRYSYSYVNGTNQIQQSTMEKVVDDNSGHVNKYKTVSKTVVNYGQEVQYAYPTEQQQWINIGQTDQQIIKISMGYDFGTGRKISQSDGKGNTTRYKYDAAGRLIKAEHPDFTNAKGETYSEVEDLSYVYSTPSLDSTNAGNRTLNVRSTETLTKIADGSTMKTYVSSYYNSLGLMLMEEKWDEYQGKWVQTQYHYDDLARPVYMIDAVGNVITASYDAWGQQNLSTDMYGNRYVTEYNLKSRNNVSYMQAAETGEKFNYLSQNYDHRGNLTSNMTYKDWPSQSKPIRETYRYDILGNIIAYTDPNNNQNADGVTTSYSYDPLGRLVSLKNALNQTTFYTYDGNGKVTNITIKAANGLTENVSDKKYNELGVLKEKRDGSSNSEKLQYNALGLPEIKTDRKGTTFNYQYDERNRLKSELLNGKIGLENGSQETKYIFSDGRTNQNTILSYTNGTQTASLNESIDSMGRKRSYYAVAGNHSAYILSQKDAIGRSTQINDYFLGFYTNYQYDKQRISKIQANGNQAIDGAASANVLYNYFANGQVQSIIYPTLTDNSTLKTEYAYNKALNWVESVTNKKGDRVLSQFQYTYDNNGNVISIVETKPDGSVQISNYVYDALNRLSITNRNGSVYKESYTYDLQGNRKTLEVMNETEKEFTDTSYAYNLENVLTSVTKGTSKTDYLYYADGLRFKKINGGSETQYNYNFNAEVITEEKNSGQKANYVRGDRVLVKKEKTDGKDFKDYYYLYNGHGDVTQIVDTSGKIVNSYTYDEWGNILNQTEEISNPFKYTGEMYDEETGLYYLRARYYDPSIGRFLNEDTYEGKIDNPLSLNLYTYVENNPLNFTDPSGHYKNSDDPVLRALIKPFEDNYNNAKAHGDKNAMKEAEKAADAVRVSYYVCDANSFCGSRANLPKDIKYRYDTYDMYLEGKYGNAHEVSILEDPIATIVFTLATDGLLAFSRSGPVAVEAGQKFYQVTSKEAAKEIMASGVLTGSKQEAGQIFVWTTKPTLAQAKNSGARSLETVIEFEIPRGALAVDRTVADNLQRYARAARGPLKIINVKEVPFK